MADEPRVVVAVLAIHPRFAEAILDGSKLVEFRKVPFRRPFDHVLIYATSPIQRVVGMFAVAGVDEAEPATLWSRYGRIGGIERREFFDYFKGRAVGVAVRVQIARRLRRPMRLEELDPAFVPPQSFLYAEAASLDLIHTSTGRTQRRTLTTTGRRRPTATRVA